MLWKPDGWWTGVNSENRSGLVPKTFLRHLPVEELSQALRILEKRGEGDTENSRQKDSKAETEETLHDSMGKAQVADESILPRSSSTSIPPLAMVMNRPVRCLGDALRADPHLTYACHLTPRLSHSNLAFHDLYWNYEDDKLRKRHVRVSCLIRLIRFEGMPRDIHTGLIRVALYDTSQKTGKQLVSNVHTIRAQIKGSTWTFISRADTANTGIDFSDFLLRSNYKSKEVILLLQASVITFEEGHYVENALGSYKLSMIGDNFESCIAKKTYTDYLTSENIFDRESTPSKTNFKIVLKALDVPKDLVQYVDALPDVLLYNPMFIRITYFYRRRAGTLLLRDRSNPLSAEMISDPLLSAFPFVADQPDLMDLITGMWMSRFKQLKIKTEVNQAQTFFHIFMNTAYCIHRTAVMPDYCMWDKKVLAERQEVLKKCVDMLREYKSAARFLLTTTSKPINIYDYSMDIMGIHALD
ncbi:unnamed protein product [Auanema sp. JU1783]|nr:unnamed protein product [Auanema sp. JU1783]